MFFQIHISENVWHAEVSLFQVEMPVMMNESTIPDCECGMVINLKMNLSRSLALME